MKKYQIIYADPPYQYSDSRGAKSRGCAKSAYTLMPIEQIKALQVKSISDKNSVLFLWATMPMLKEAIEIIEAWGFLYRTCTFVWVKLNPSVKSPLFITLKDIYSGLGYWTNGNAELCLFGRRGRPVRMTKNVKQIILAPRGKHSVKPPEVRKRIVKLMGNLPRIELFAREKPLGWDVWGNEIKSDINL